MNGIWTQRAQAIDLDTSGVEELTAAAIAALIRLTARARRLAVPLRLTHAAPHVALQLGWAHLDALMEDSARGGAWARREGEPQDAESWLDVRTLSLDPGDFTIEQLATALFRTAIGDTRIEAAVAELVQIGPALFGLIANGQITLDRDIDERGGGWWANVDWHGLSEAASGEALLFTPAHRVHIQAATGLAGGLR